MKLRSYTFLHDQYLHHIKSAKKVDSMAMSNWHRGQARSVYLKMARLAEVIPLEVVLQKIQFDARR